MSNVPPNPYLPQNGPDETNPYRPPSDSDYSYPAAASGGPEVPGYTNPAENTGYGSPLATPASSGGPGNNHPTPDAAWAPNYDGISGSAVGPSYSTDHNASTGPSYATTPHLSGSPSYASPYAVPGGGATKAASKNSTGAVIAIIVAVVVGIVGLVIAFGVFLSSSSPTSSPDPTQVDPGRGSSQTPGPSSSPSVSTSGSRDNPNPLGSELVSTDWTVTVTDVDMDATDYLISEDSYLEQELGSDMKYILVDLTAIYTGDETGMSYDVLTDFVSSKGQVYNDVYAYFPDRWGDVSEVYPGGELSGRVAIAIPEGETGVIRITPGYSYDVEPFFVATE